MGAELLLGEDLVAPQATDPPHGATLLADRIVALARHRAHPLERAGRRRNQEAPVRRNSPYV